MLPQTENKESQTIKIPSHPANCATRSAMLWPILIIVLLIAGCAGDVKNEKQPPSKNAVVAIPADAWKAPDTITIPTGKAGEMIIGDK